MLLKKISTLAIVSATLLTILGFTMLGCASTYHEYPDCVPYNYCPLPPLPHTFYDGCPTPVAEQFNQSRSESIVPISPQNIEN